MQKDTNVLDEILHGLMSMYRDRVPDVGKTIKAMIREGLIRSIDDIENDHIAFRTLGVPPLGIASLEKIFLYHGYEKRDHFYFGIKKLDAYWYAPPSPRYPRIFLSELRVTELSERAQQIITSYTEGIKTDPVDNLDLNNAQQVVDYLHMGLWRTPTIEDYNFLSQESEYAAWVIYNRYYLNHFTISVHNLKTGYNTITNFNEFLERNGMILNDAGGKIKISPDGGLLQSSTVAKMITANFAFRETMMIPGSYVEFAERKILPQFQDVDPSAILREHRRDGFETANADRIFESTYHHQTQKTK